MSCRLVGMASLHGLVVLVCWLQNIYRWVLVMEIPVLPSISNRCFTPNSESSLIQMWIIGLDLPQGTWASIKMQRKWSIWFGLLCVQWTRSAVHLLGTKCWSSIGSVESNQLKQVLNHFAFTKASSVTSKSYSRMGVARTWLQQVISKSKCQSGLVCSTFITLPGALLQQLLLQVDETLDLLKPKGICQWTVRTDNVSGLSGLITNCLSESWQPPQEVGALLWNMNPRGLQVISGRVLHLLYVQHPMIIIILVLW
jgi:hypothetical protein